MTTIASLTSATSPLTQKGSIVGTFQLLRRKCCKEREADARSDIFSFGCALYEMVDRPPRLRGKLHLSVIHLDSWKRPSL